MDTRYECSREYTVLDLVYIIHFSLVLEPEEETNKKRMHTMHNAVPRVLHDRYRLV